MAESINHSPTRYPKDFVAQEDRLSSANKSDGPTGPRLNNQVKSVVKSNGGSRRRLFENEQL